MGERKLCADGWDFALLPPGREPSDIPGPDAPWQPVEIPHDWLIRDAENLYADGDGWYRRALPAGEIPPGARVSLRFDGVYMDSTLFVNRRRACEWKYGYTAFECDLTDYLGPGNNEIHLRVVHRAPNSRWYSGAGMYRNAWLVYRNPVHIAPDGIYVSARREGQGAWAVTVSAELARSGNGGATGGHSLRFAILDPEGRELARTEVPAGDIPEAPAAYPDRDASRAGAEAPAAKAELRVDSPRRWDPADPALHILVTEVVDPTGTVVDTERVRFGFREMAFSPDRGLSFNGRPTKLRGVCLHHDLGCLGAAVNAAALRRQFAILKGMGVNALRTSHNPPAREFMDLADETGMLVVSEAFDMWEKPKTPFDYARFFPEWAERDVASWIRRDRNSPSVVMWSIGNEIHDTHAGPRGLEVTARLAGLVALHDERGNAPATIGSNYMPWENAQKCADVVKLAGYNYAESYYGAHRAAHPDWVIYGSETSSIVQSRGVYHFPASRSILAEDDEQCSSLGNSPTSWGAKSIDACIADDRDAAFSPGQFLWSGFDYIGEPTPYHTRNSYFGQVDTAGFPKDSYWRYKSEWTSLEDGPTVHLFPYWDFNEGQLVDVIVCSNAPTVALFRDGVPVGREDIDHARGRKLHASWKLPWAPGKLEAVAYDGAGREVARDSVRSFGDAATLTLGADKSRLVADGRDLAFVEISARDAEGNPVANANNRVRVRVSGAGRLVGLDNGDSTDTDEYKGTSRRLFGGKLLAVIAAKGETGPVEVTVSSPSLPDARLALEAIKSPHGILGAALDENRESPGNDEIPVRKIELSCDGGTALGPERREATVSARLRPEGATWRDLDWRVTDDGGIDSNLARLEPLGDGSAARVTALGDGAFRLRCSTKNGADKTRLISQLGFSVTGLGKAWLDPYAFVSGGLWSRTNAELGNGNERGVATPREGESLVCFDGLDFGPWGSDELTIPVFALDGEPFPVEIWSGMPGDPDRELLARETYDIPTIWNTYQPVTWKLSRRLRGIASVCFSIGRKVHLKGFAFARDRKAWATLSALENDGAYGDAFTPVPERDAIENIGNNVSLEFGGMDFGDEPCSVIVICGRTPLERNSITIRFEGEGGADTRIVEFPRCAGYEERAFAIEPVRGDRKVTFVFLPGCRFDFRWFRFEKG